MRNMSFALTTPQMLARTKTVTRRLGWASLKPGTLIQAVEKSQGLGKGGKVRKLGVIRVLDVRREPIGTLLADLDYGCSECVREGFPQMVGGAFVQMFVKRMGGNLSTVVTRIEFEHVEDPQPTFGALRRSRDVFEGAAVTRRLKPSKPCPCCGGVGELVRWLGMVWFSQVQCRTCYTSGPAIAGRDYDDRQKPAAEAIKRWNDMPRAA